MGLKPEACSPAKYSFYFWGIVIRFRMKPVQTWLPFAILVVVFLAFLSFETTAKMWDSGYRDGKVVLQIQNSSGQPIKDAQLIAFNAKATPDSAAQPSPGDFPFSPVAPVSDGDGRMVFTHTKHQAEADGIDWKLFWVIPFHDGQATWSCKIVANGYQPQYLPFDKLFDPKNETSAADASASDQPVYQTTIVLER